MKKLATALLTTAALTSAMMAAEGMSFYGGGGLAIEAVPDDDTLSMGTAIVLRGGMNLPMVLEGFGAEVELTKSVINPEYEWTNYSNVWPFAPYTTTKDVSVLTLAAYAVYTIELGDKFYVKPRFGIILPNLGDSNSDVWGAGSSGGWVNSRDITFSSGIGGGFKVMKNMNIYVDYTVLGENVTNYGAGVEYHF